MTFSYDINLGSDKDQVRFALGDVSTPNHLVEDEEILALLGAGNGASVVAYKSLGRWRLAKVIRRHPECRTATQHLLDRIDVGAAG